MLAWSRIARTAAVQIAAAAFILVPAGTSFAATAADSGLTIGPVAPETPGLKAHGGTAQKQPSRPTTPRRVKPVAPSTRTAKAPAAPKKAAARSVQVAQPVTPATMPAVASATPAATSNSTRSLGSTTLTMSAAQTPDTQESLVTFGPWLLLGTLVYTVLLATRRYAMERLRQPIA